MIEISAVPHQQYFKKNSSEKSVLKSSKPIKGTNKQTRIKRGLLSCFKKRVRISGTARITNLDNKWKKENPSKKQEKNALSKYLNSS